jgi:DNA-binding NtrC family response regulator
MEQRAQIVYAGKNAEADFQFLSIAPASLYQDQITEIPQAQLRLHAPLLVRHHFGSEARPDHLGGQRDTLKWLADRNDPSRVSPLEWSQQCRYIPSGEFTFLLLIWLWTGEPSTETKAAPGKERKVALEKKLDAGRNGSTMLLQMLMDLGLGSEIEEMFGTLTLEGESWIRSSTRLEDFISLGLIAPQDSGAAKLTEKAGIFARWLKGAVDAVRAPPPPSSPTADSPYNLRRLGTLLQQAHGQTWLEALDGVAADLLSACAASDANAYADSLCNLLDGFYNQVSRYKLREMLRTDGFPVYPVVHLTMLFGIPQPLDWLALPLGGTVVGDENPELDSLPQGAAYVLSIHREPHRIPALVQALTTTLEIPVSAYASQWAEHVINETRRELAKERARKVKWADSVQCPSEAMKPVYEAIGKAAHSKKTTVLILGETGTGKEVAARDIHGNSERSEKPFIALSCANLSEELLETKLFGRVKGAYTSATDDKDGLIKEADGGTLFLDEVGELSLRMQAKLLRFLQERTYEKVGDTKAEQADVRIIAATNSPLDAKVRAGEFREDLLYRLDVIRIELPPLRDHLDDVPLLVEHLVKKHARENGSPVPRMDSDVIADMVQFDWPGNVRQLENVAQRAVLWCEHQITREYIAQQIQVERAKLLARTGPEKRSTPVEPGVRGVTASFRSLPVLAALDEPPFDESVAAIKHAWKPDANAKHWSTIPAEERKAIREIVGKLAKGDENVLRKLAKLCDITFATFKKYAVGDES